MNFYKTTDIDYDNAFSFDYLIEEYIDSEFLYDVSIGIGLDEDSSVYSIIYSLIISKDGAFKYLFTSKEYSYKDDNNSVQNLKLYEMKKRRDIKINKLLSI